MIAVDANMLVYAHREDSLWHDAALKAMMGRLEHLVLAAKAAGPMVHDARIAALCLSHGVRQFWSADRDFSRFPALKIKNPLVG